MTQTVPPPRPGDASDDGGAHPGARDVTVILQAIAGGDRLAADRLLPMVYDELRRLARQHMGHEPAGNTLQSTALVHEAYVRLLGPGAGSGSGGEMKWDSRGHFFAAAAIAMRRILVERARARGRLKRGGGAARQELDENDVAADDSRVDLVGLDEALAKLEQHDARKHQVVMLRYFAGLSIEDTASALALSPTTVKSDWLYARAWLHREMSPDGAAPPRQGGEP